MGFGGDLTAAAFFGGSVLGTVGTTLAAPLADTTPGPLHHPGLGCRGNRWSAVVACKTVGRILTRRLLVLRLLRGRRNMQSSRVGLLRRRTRI